MNTDKIEITKTIPPELDNKRLDFALSTLLPEYSRAKIQAWIKEGWVIVDNKLLRGKDKIFTDQVINVNATITIASEQRPQNIPLNIVYEDSDIIVINKPVGLVVHPGAGHEDKTLLNALLYHFPELSKLPRAGIIHRLDKDTSGLMVVTRNLISHTKLVADLQERKIKREYEAIVNGIVPVGGKVDVAIGRHPKRRTHMAAVKDGKPATTHYSIITRFENYTHLSLLLETGRTHQIRVHLAHIGYPIVGDPVYNKGLKLPPKCSDELRETLTNFKRQALHARRLGLTHPGTNELMEWEADLPKDMNNLLKILS